MLARDDKSTACVRDIVASIVRDAWAKAQDWTVAWKTGKTQLKSVVESLINLPEDEQVEPLVHESALQLHTCITKMQACVSILNELLENLIKVEKLQTGKKCNQPLFSTLTLHQMACVLESVCEDYRKETEIKAGLCTVLPHSHNVDTLNTALTLWTHHVHLVTHQFPLKSLLRETQQL
ncbi:uncharacterized protein LOC135212977 [Macrobrachium nipponense]|uniref:uncharacterized protein LOC135212977 n=1 Tax=Macrobrachium nipponense TaxID=159736 RepID=UPI0030C7F0DA